ncbi:olfactory receptor 4D1-like [Genypterus blacodes]|uniref:olfactory receptor 4D1-like n=1 Tax=Genypterus blacodes TaxID=154954 RepID=UPI003F75BE3E
MPLQNVSIQVTEFILGDFNTKRPVVIGVVILIIYVVIIFANTVNILLIVYDKRLHKPMYLLICHLAVVDIMYTSSVSPTLIGALLAGIKTIPYLSCLIQMYIFTMANILVMFALSIMAFDRLVAISYPLRYHSFLSNTRLLVLTCVLWVVAFAFVFVLPATVVPLPHCHSKLIYSFCDYAAIIRTTCVDPSYYFNKNVRV